MCKRILRDCSNIGKGTCVSEKKVWVSMEGYKEPWVMIDERFEPCTDLSNKECAGTSNEGYYPPEQPDCKNCTAKKSNEQLIKKHGTLRLQALVEQRHAEQAAKSPTTTASGNPIILDSLTIGPMPTAGSANTGRASLGETTPNPSSHSAKPVGKLSTLGMSGGNLGGKTIVPGPNGGTIGVESLNLNPDEGVLSEPTIKLGFGAAEAGSATCKRGRSVESTGPSATNSRTSSQASNNRLSIASGPIVENDSISKSSKKTDSAAPTLTKKDSAALTPKKKR